MLKIQNISVFYHQRQILFGIDLDVRSGEVVALIGPNGAGKSTLIRAVSGVIPILSGNVHTNGDHFSTLSPIQRARYIATVPQAVMLPPAYTVWETVLFGRTPYLNFLGQFSEKDEERARFALERVHALDLLERRVGELSGGEQQRVLLARALCQSTPILLLDEPTAHLDLQYQVSLLELVHELAHKDNLAVLIALHDLNLRRPLRGSCRADGCWAVAGSRQPARGATVRSDLTCVLSARAGSGASIHGYAADPATWT